VQPEELPIAPPCTFLSNTYCTEIWGILSCQYRQMIKSSKISNAKSTSLYVHNRHIRFSAPRVVMRHNARQWQPPVTRGRERNDRLERRQSKSFTGQMSVSSWHWPNQYCCSAELLPQEPGRQSACHSVQMLISFQTAGRSSTGPVIGKEQNNSADGI